MTAAAPTRQRSKALAAFFEQYQERLERVVANRARNADDHDRADACAIAWLKLIRRPDIDLDGRGFAWLVLVATREAWRFTQPQAEVPCGAFLPNSCDEGERDEPPGLTHDPLDLVLAAEVQHDRVRRFATLKPRERRDLLLLAGGYRYKEIAAATGSTYTAVNRRITKGRARLRAT